MIMIIKKVCKWTTLSIGGLILAGVGAAGCAGIYFKDTAVQFYSENRTRLQGYSQQISSQSGNIITLLDEFQKAPEAFKGEITNLETQLTNEIEKIKTTVNSINSNINGQNIPEIEQTKNQLNSTISTVQSELSNVSSQVNQVVDQVASYIPQETVDSVKNIINKVNTDILPAFDNVLNTVTPEVFEQYYGLGTYVMAGVGLGVLGLGLITTFISLIFYKSVDGKVVRRGSEKKELKSHLKYILKKYPELKKELL